MSTFVSSSISDLFVEFIPSFDTFSYYVLGFEKINNEISIRFADERQIKSISNTNQKLYLKKVLITNTFVVRSASTTFMRISASNSERAIMLMKTQLRNLRGEDQR